MPTQHRAEIVRQRIEVTQVQARDAGRSPRTRFAA
jgi:hypothetical protein